MADEKLVRLHNLKNVLKSKHVEERDRARYLSAKLGSNVSYWSGMLAGARSFGEKVARRIEEGLELPRTSLDSEAHDWTPSQPAPEGVGAHPVAHDVSPLRRDDAPIAVEWERILKDPLKREFQTTMPDASMEPDIPRGAGIIFVTDLQPAPGDWVLIRDREGNAFVRELRQVKPGRWQAHALNPAFLPMDSDADGLQVLAVFDGLRGRKARV